MNPAGLAAVLRIEFADGSRTNFLSDATWRTAQAEQPHWREVTFDDGHWLPARVTAAFGQSPWGTVGQTSSSVAPQSCGIGNRLRVVYLLDNRAVLVRGLQPQETYRLVRFDPVTGTRESATEMATSRDGTVLIAPPTHGHDWVLLLERINRQL